MTIKDGGPAFPTSKKYEWNEKYGYKAFTADDGMTLRDYFAAKAMQVLYQESVADIKDNPSHEIGFGDVAKYAYALADSMLYAREVTP